MVRDATPLRRDEPGERDLAEATAKPETAPAGGATSSRPAPAPSPCRVTPPPAARPRPAPPLHAGEFAGLDRRSADRLRRGQIKIDARLDLHGMTRAAAQDALRGFIAAAAARGDRCVLVITGKGAFSEAGGVLRREVPRWLNLPDLRPKVVAFTEAQPRHGGGGALYVLLRRQRAG